MFQMKSKKKKNEKKDFTKVKLKVGKGKRPAANATDTSFKESQQILESSV